MTTWYLIPLIVGVCITGQSLMNKELSLPYGLATATLLTSLVFGFVCSGLFLWTLKNPTSLPDFFFPKIENYRFQWWHLLPGLAGFFIVLLTPLAIHHLGAAPVSIGIVFTQILFSFIWDISQGGTPISPWRWLGLGLVLAGGFLYHRG